MQIRLGEVFNTVRTEGSILPADLLARVAAGDKTIEGLTPDDYELDAGENIGEVLNRAWNSLVGTWWSFQSALQKLPDVDPATTLTRERWLLPLLEALGFGRLTATKAIEVESRTYAISHISRNTPIHLVGFHVDLDRRSPGVAGAARSSPHSVVQELLNRSPSYLWGIVSNGKYLRILRDNVSLTRQAYLEFDLEAMMAGEVYSDFVLFWLLAHRSRFAATRPEECWLERWSQAANDQGTRALDQLRSGVENAILALGRGFIGHPHNRRLREELADERLSTQDYYRQLLRVVYRLIFLFVAEDRELLLDQDADEAARNRYLRYYSVGRLRRLAARTGGSKYVDLYRALVVLAEQLDADVGCSGLGLPGLGSFLWSREATSALNACDLANRDLLEAITALAFTVSGKVRRTVDYKNLGSEELGSVYESLLELHPQVDVEARTFVLASAGGNERKTTGSYYTPTSLISSLLDTALEPLIENAATRSHPEQSLLDLKIVDPACGSGHFLIAAAHRLAKKLAAIRTGDEEPSPAATRSALRDVIGRCVFGVDVNEMAVELCKISLWMEAIDPGRPLSFLDHHILCGNSLLGATPAVLAKGIPERAFQALDGDDEAVIRALRRRNGQELAGQIVLPTGEGIAEVQVHLSKGIYEIDALADTSSLAVREKALRYQGLVSSPEARRAKLAADAWCTAFVAPRDETSSAPITEGVYRQIASNPDMLTEEQRREINDAAARYRFFHWHLAFPDVFQIPTDGRILNPATGWSGGFDVVLGNPPWGQTELAETEWFAERSPDISAASGVARKRLISDLAEVNPKLYARFRQAKRGADAVGHFIRDSGRFPLSGRGRINSYAPFAEAMWSIVAATGRVGAIIPSGIATDDTTKTLFAALIQKRSLDSLYDFENAAPLFQDVHRSYKFSLLTLTGAASPVDSGRFFFFAHTVSDLGDVNRQLRLTASDFSLFNPNTRTCPVFRFGRDADLAGKAYKRLPILVRRGTSDGNAWNIHFRQGLFNMTGDSALFRSGQQLADGGWQLDGNVFYRGRIRYVPLYESKMLHLLDSRWATYDAGRARELSPTEKADPTTVTIPRYWVREDEVDARLPDKEIRWLWGWRNVARTTDERTLIASPLPRAGVGHSEHLAFTSGELYPACLLASFCSFALDYLLRLKLGGSNLSFFIIEQLPIIPPSVYGQPAPWDRSNALATWLTPRLVELAYSTWDLRAFAYDLGFGGAPFIWDDRRRHLIWAELDAAFFHLYGFARPDVNYIMESFPIVRRKDEVTYGDYRTKLMILDRYDSIDRAINSGRVYKTPLDPDPADPRVAHLSRPSPPGAASR